MTTTKSGKIGFMSIVGTATVYKDFKIKDVTTNKYLRSSKTMYNYAMPYNSQKFSLDKLYLPIECKKHFILYDNKQLNTYKFWILQTSLVLKIEINNDTNPEVYFTFPLTVHNIKTTRTNKLLLLGVDLAEIPTSLQVLQFVEEDRVFREKGGDKHHGIRSKKKQQQLQKASTPRERVFRYKS